MLCGEVRDKCTMCDEVKTGARCVIRSKQVHVV